jgi:hypothetical protein
MIHLLKAYSAKKNLNLFYSSIHKEIGGEVEKQIQIRKSDNK